MPAPGRDTEQQQRRRSGSDTTSSERNTPALGADGTAHADAATVAHGRSGHYRGSPAGLLRLQRLAGNRAVRSMVDPAGHASPATFGHGPVTGAEEAADQLIEEAAEVEAAAPEQAQSAEPELAGADGADGADRADGAGAREEGVAEEVTASTGPGPQSPEPHLGGEPAPAGGSSARAASPSAFGDLAGAPPAVTQAVSAFTTLVGPEVADLVGSAVASHMRSAPEIPTTEPGGDDRQDDDAPVDGAAGGPVGEASGPVPAGAEAPAPPPAAEAPAPAPAPPSPEIREAPPAPEPRPVPVAGRPRPPAGGGGSAPPAPGLPGTQAPLSSDGSLDRWRAAAQGAAQEITPPDTAAVDASAEQLSQANRELDTQRRGARPDPQAELEARVARPPENPPRQSTLDTSMADRALAALQAVAERRLPAQGFGPLTAMPAYEGRRTPAPRMPGQAPPAPPPGPEVTEAAQPTTSGPVQVDPRADDVGERVRQAGEPQQQQLQPGGAVTLQDTGPPSADPLPDGQRTDFAQVVAAAIRTAPQTATRIVATAGRQIDPSGDTTDFQALAQAKVDAQSDEIRRELEAVADAAGVTGEQLQAQVQEQTRRADEARAQACLAIEDETTQARAATQQRGEEELAEIGGAAAGKREQARAQAEAASGGPDEAAINRRRDEFLQRHDGIRAAALAHVRLALETREADLDRIGGQRKAAYNRMGQLEAQRRQAMWTDDPNRGRVDGRQALDWARAQAEQVDVEVVNHKAAANTAATGIRESLTGQWERGRNEIRDWAASQEGRERSWWERLLDLFSDWMHTVDEDVTAYEEAKARGTRDQVAGDFDLLLRLREAQLAGNDQAVAEQIAQLSAEERAMVQLFFQSGGNAITAVATRLVGRIEAQRTPELVRALEAEAIEALGWEALDELGRAQSPGFNAGERARNIHRAVDGMGTDDDAVWRGLAGLTSIQAAALRKCYSATYDGADLDDDLEGDFSGSDEDRALAMLSGDPVAAAVASVYASVRGAGTDERTIMETLRGLTPAQRAEVERRYLAEHGETLDAALRDDLHDDNELGQALALSRGDLESADAFELRQAFDNDWLGVLPAGTDEDAAFGVYRRIRTEVEAQAAERGMTTAEVEAEIQRRLGGLRSAYDAESQRRGDGEESLETRFTSEFESGELDMVRALQAGDRNAEAAATLRMEHESAVYADDERINSTLRDTQNRARQDVERDRAVHERELRARARAEGWPPERLRAETERLSQWARDETTRRGRENFELVESAYDDARGMSGAMRFDMHRSTSGYGNDELETLLDTGGVLTPAQELRFAIYGEGTDEARIRRILQGPDGRGLSAAQIAELEREYAAITGGASLRSDLEGDLSGREEDDMVLMLGGTRTPEERLAYMQARQALEGGDAAAREASGLGQLSNWMADDEQAVMATTLRGAEGAYADYERILQQHDGNTEHPDVVRARQRFERWSGYHGQDVDAYRAEIDLVADRAAMAAAVVAGVVVVVLSGGLAAPAVAGGAAAATGGGITASTAVAAAAASTAASMAVRATIRQSAYGIEDIGMDAATGTVDALVAYTTFGLGNAVMASRAASVLQGLASRGTLGRLAHEGIGEAIENALTSVPSAVVGAALDDNLWHGSDPLLALAQAAGQSMAAGVATGAVVSAGMSGVGHLAGQGGAPGRDGGGTHADADAASVASVVDEHADAGVSRADTEAGVDPAEAGRLDGGAPEHAPRSPGRDEVIDLDDPANAHLIEDIDGVDPRQPHVGEDGVIDLDDPRNRWMLEDAVAGRLPDELAADPVASREFFEGFMRSQPGLEAALLRNADTGEHIIVQGSTDSVDIRQGHGVWEQLIPPDTAGQGRWDLVVHSHPIDPSGVTPGWARVPSGATGDFAWTAYQAAASGGPVVQEIRITTEAGADVTRYGYDPDHAEPYSIDFPGAGGSREAHRFATIDDYHQWYTERFGGDLGVVPDSFSGRKRADETGAEATTDADAVDDEPTRETRVEPTTPTTPTGVPGTPDAPPSARDALIDLEARIEALEGTEAPTGDLIDQVDAIDPRSPGAREQIRALDDRVRIWESEGPGPAAEGLGELTAESEAARRATLGAARERLEANGHQGSVGEQRVMDEVLSGMLIPELGSSATLRGSQVHVQTSAGLRIVDHLVELPSGELVALEVKTGGAVRDLYQIECDLAMELHGGIVLGGNAPGISGPSPPIRTVVLQR